MKILIITYYRYPNGDAGAVRQHNLAKLYKSIGLEVLIIGMGSSELNKVNEFDGISYVSFRHPPNNKLAQFKNILLYVNNLKKLLSREKDSFNIIQIANTHPHIIQWLKHYCKNKKITLVHDSVEWYSPSQFSLGKLSPSYLIKDISNKYLIDKRFKVIAISKFLEAHFVGKNIETVRIPVFFDVSEFRNNISNNDKLTLMYAGSPGRKDFLDVMLKGIANLDKELLEKLEVRIFGVDNQDVKSLFYRDNDSYLRIQNTIKVFGHVSRDVVIKNLQDSDFSVMLRNSNLRYSKAGFPTKIVESLSCGIPVITNISSDLGDYLIDLENSIIVNDYTSNSFANAIEKALRLKKDDLNNLKVNAFNTALNNFDISLYSNILKDFLNSRT